MQGAEVDQIIIKIIEGHRVNGVDLFCFLREDYMKKLFSLVVVCILSCLTVQAWAAPVAPTMSYTVDGTQLSISWDSDPEATGYKLNYATTYTGTASFIPMDLGDKTSFNYDYLVEGQTYTIAIQAYSDIGNSGYSNIETFTVPMPILPAAPELTATTSGLDLSLSWTAVTDATGYILSYAPTSSYSGPESFITNDVGGDTSFSAVLWEGAAFVAAVQAYNNQGVSDYSNIEPLTVDPEIPFALIDWRTRESRSDYGVQWIEVPHSLKREDVVDLRLVNSQNETVRTYNDFEFVPSSESFHMDCLSGTCRTAEAINDAGYYSTGSDLTAGTYTFVLETTLGSTLEKESVYKGKIRMPIISGQSIASSWNVDGSLNVEWENPTTDPDWGLVKQIRLDVSSTNSGESITARFLPGFGNSITIPASELALVFNETDLSSLRIRMVTRAIDAEGFHYARGRSDWVDIIPK